MSLLQEIFRPDFPFRNSIYESLLVGFACPLVGVYLLLRRLVFLGATLPQVSSCGIAFAFALPAWGILPQLHNSAEERALAFAGSLVFTLAALVLLAVLERRGRGMVEGRIGVAYVLAGACGILLLVENPHGEHGMLELLRGEIIAVSGADLRRSAATFTLVVGFLLVFRKELLLVSFDRDMAVTLGKRVVVWDVGLYTAIGLTVSVAVMVVGPLVAFGFLLLPGFVAYQWAGTMKRLLWMSSLVGMVGALAGFMIAYHLDWPVGPTDIVLLGTLLVLSWLARCAWRRLAGARAG